MNVKHLFLLIIGLVYIPFVACAQSDNAQSDNEEIRNLFKADQADRQETNYDREKLRVNDSLRKSKINELIKAGQIKTGRDYYHSAMIFQHGQDSLDSEMAVKLMQKAIEADSTIDKWLLAAAIDRDLMRKGKPQIYGTQFQKAYTDTKWKRYQLDSMQVTDEERKKYNVETLAEQQLKLKLMNRLEIDTLNRAGY